MEKIKKLNNLKAKKREKEMVLLNFIDKEKIIRSHVEPDLIKQGKCSLFKII